MELTKEEIIKISHNYLNIDEDDTYLRFKRFTTKQLQQYKEDGIKRNTDYVSHCLGNANISFDFLTDSNLLGLRFKIVECTSRILADFDLYVDNCFYDHKSLSSDYSVLSFNLPEGLHHVQLYFPWSCEVKIQKVILSDNSRIEYVNKDYKILSLGDSITQGYHCVHPSLTYANIVMRSFDAEVINQGCGGYYFESKTLADELRDINPDLITVAYGTNDFSQLDNREEFKKRCQLYLKRLRELFNDKDVLVILPIPRVDEKGRMRDMVFPYTLKDAMEIIKETALAEGMYYLESAYYPAHGDFYAPDGLHPNDLGFGFYGRAVVEKIKEIRKGRY